MSSNLIVKTAYANIYSEPSFGSELVTQALFFEVLEVISSHGDWLEVSQWDGYVGYTHRFYLSDNFSTKNKNFLVRERSLPMYDSLDFNNIIAVAPFTSHISVTSSEDGYYTTESIDGRSYFFKSNSDRLKSSDRAKMIEYSKKLIGSPYLWGGKTPFGYDCSGFVQSVCKAVGINIKRDTSVQINDDRMDSVDTDSARIGDLVFFNMVGKGVDHVGIWMGEDDVIHCGGEVKVQSIDDTSHKKLRDHIINIKSIDRLINE